MSTELDIDSKASWESLTETRGTASAGQTTSFALSCTDISLQDQQYENSERTKMKRSKAELPKGTKAPRRRPKLEPCRPGGSRLPPPVIQQWGVSRSRISELELRLKDRFSPGRGVQNAIRATQ